MNQNTRLKRMIYTALMTAFVFVATMTIRIPVPFTNGYIHAGDTFIFVSGLLLGPWHAAFAAGVGSAFADFFGGYSQWVIPTLIVKSIMGFIIGSFATTTKKHKYFYQGSMGIWVVVVLTFLFVLRTVGIPTISNLLEETHETTEGIVRNLNIQLAILAIALPALTALLYKLKEKYHVSFHHLIGMIFAGVWMILGYYIATGVMYGSFIIPIFGIPADIVQFSIGAILAFMISSALKKAGLDYEHLHPTN